MNLSYKEIRELCLKPDEASKPLYARHVTHTISTRLIWLFQNTPVAPNHLTLASLFLAFAALPLFSSMTPRSVMTGAVLIELYYVFDAVDGQWARLTGKKSLTGAFFDYLINYLIQPPLVFAIGYGVFAQTNDVTALTLGFWAGFSTLWVVLIWNLRASILLAHFSHNKKIPSKPAVTPESEAKRAGSLGRVGFGWAHKLMVFPWFMHVLTLCSLFCWLAAMLGIDDFTIRVFKGLLIIYGLGGPVVAFLLTARWILRKSIDSSPELG